MRVLHMTDNAGVTDEHRALNYLAMRFPAIYTRAAEEFARDFSLTGVEVRPSPFEQHAQYRRCHLLLYQSQHRFYGKVFRARRRDRGVSFLGHQDIAVL
jgi:PatG C-terminal